jgi:hypothetical protein
MDSETLQTMALGAIITAAVIFAFTYLFEWIVRKIEEAKMQAAVEERRRSEQESELASQRAMLDLQQFQQRLIARGMTLLNGGGERPVSYKDITSLYGLIGKLEKELNRHAKQCF